MHTDTRLDEESLDLCEQQLCIAESVNDRRHIASANWNLGLTHLELGHPTQAVEELQACVDIERVLNDPDAENDAAFVDAIRARAV